MSSYVVQAGDTPMSIAHRLTGDRARLIELVRQNPHKPLIGVGQVMTFRELYVGECLSVPHNWGSPGMEVAASAQDGDPILTISGPQTPAVQAAPAARGKPCCDDCARKGTRCCKPGKSATPVGFGQTPPLVTTSTAASVLQGWGVPLAIGAISLAAGFGLAYVIRNR